MKCLRCAICHETIVDSQTGLVSLINITDVVTLKELPVTIPMLCFFASIKKSVFELPTVEGSLSIKQADKVINTLPVTVDFKSNHLLNMTFRFELFTISKKGDIEVLLTLGKSQVANAKLEVRIGTNIVIPELRNPGGQQVM